jgi:biopolymer transport protein ExbD
LNFQKRAAREEPEINLIPLIDLFLVIIIFLMVTTTYSRFSELKIDLPTADATQQMQKPSEIDVGVSSKGVYSIDGKVNTAKTADDLAQLLTQAKVGKSKDVVLVIDADAQTTHQSVITVMQAARASALPQVTFTTQSPQGK